MTFWRNGLEMTPKSPRFKAVLLFKMQTRQIETKKKHIFRQCAKRIFILTPGMFWFI